MTTQTRSFLYMCAVALILTARTASAFITITSETKTTPSSGGFDVFVQTDESPLISSFNLTVAPVVTTSGDIVPADVALNFNTANNGNPVTQPDLLPGDDVTEVAFPAVSGAAATATPAALFDGAGLMSVLFDVTPGKQGTFTVDLNPTVTQLFDDRFTAVPNVTLGSGTITVQAEPLTIAPESKTTAASSGTFDVVVQTKLTPMISSYNLTVEPVVTTTGDITPADVTLSFNTANNGNSVTHADLLPSDDVTEVAFPAVSGASATATPAPLFDGAGLMSVAYDVTPGKLGSFSVDLNPNVTQLFDDSFRAIPGVDLARGTVTIVPEPATLSLLAVGALAALRRRRRR